MCTVLMVLEVILVVLGVVLVFLGMLLVTPSKLGPLKQRPHYRVIDLALSDTWANYYWAIITRFKGVLKVFNRTLR